MYNRVILMGRLTKDPELRTTQSGITMCRFSVAVERAYSRGEEKQTDFFDVTVWRQTAEFVSKYFSKGRMILIEGSIQNSNYTDQNGVKHYATAIMGERVSFCGDKSGAQGQPDYRPSQAYVPQQSAAPAQAPQPVEPGDLGDFEEILSDGEVPF
jgi:single-strand DNA-binding protein